MPSQLQERGARAIHRMLASLDGLASSSEAPQMSSTIVPVISVEPHIYSTDQVQENSAVTGNGDAPQILICPEGEYREVFGGVMYVASGTFSIQGIKFHSRTADDQFHIHRIAAGVQEVTFGADFGLGPIRMYPGDGIVPSISGHSVDGNCYATISFIKHPCEFTGR